MPRTRTPQPLAEALRATSMTKEQRRALRKRLNKQFSANEREVAQQRQYAASTARVLNRSTLRNRNLAAPVPGMVSGHVQKWNPEGIEMRSLQSIGSLKSWRERDCHREIEFISCAAMSHEEAQGELMREKRWMIECGAYDCYWTRRVSHFDLTPVVVGFGQFADMLRPVAKYFWRTTTAAHGIENQRWVKLSWDEYRSRNMSRVPER